MPRSWIRASLVVVFFCGLSPNVWAQVSGNSGSFTTSVPIAVPSYRGLEPSVALVYNSSGGNGIAGVGWSLTGFSSIERQGADGGAPNYNTYDTYRLGGTELKECGASSSPGCLAGGTHFTEHENYQRIEFDGVDWTVTRRNGTTLTYTPVFLVGTDTFRWGLTTVEDVLGTNTVTYNWWCDWSAPLKLAQTELDEVA